MNRDRFDRLTPLHLTDDQLIRLRDGELAPEETEKARQHLDVCWQCRHRAERFAAVVLDFVDYCDAVSSQAGDFRQTRAALEHRARSQALLLPKPRLMRRIRRRIAELGAWFAHPRVAISCLGVSVFLYWLLASTAISTAEAGEILRRTSLRQEGALRAIPKPAIHQRLRLTDGGETVEWEVWQTPDKRIYRDRWTQRAAFAPSLTAVYEANNLDPARWLSSDNHARWRESVHNREERVTSDKQRGEIRIWTRDRSARLQNQIREATLTMRRADLHPIAHFITAIDEGGEREYRIQEIDFSVIPFERVPPGVFDEPEPRVVRRAVSPSAIPPMKSALPTELQLEESEARLREALHTLGFDRTLMPRIRREPHSIVLQLIVENTAQRDLLVNATNDIPWLNRQIWDADSPAGAWIPAGDRAETNTTQHLRTEPAMRRELLEYFGTQDLATEYVSQVHSSFRAVLREASALQRLAERYPDPRTLRGSAKSVIERVAYADVQQVHRLWFRSSALLGPLFNSLKGAHSDDPAPERGSTGCTSWHEAGPLVALRLRELESEFNSLFVSRYRPEPMTLDASEILARAVRTRKALDSQVANLCTTK